MLNCLFATGDIEHFEDNEKFLNIASSLATFMKVVFDSKIDDDEIDICTILAKKYNIFDCTSTKNAA